MRVILEVINGKGKIGILELMFFIDVIVRIVRDLIIIKCWIRDLFIIYFFLGLILE